MTQYKNAQTRQAALTASTDRVVARVSDLNRHHVERAVQRRRNEGLKASSIRTYAAAMLRADRFLGKPFEDATPQDLADMLSQMREELSERSVAITAILLRRGWKDVLDVDALPRPIYKALYVREPRLAPSGRVISDSDFSSLLGAVEQVEAEFHTVEQALPLTALLWTAWDSGFRARELLSLNVGDVDFEDQDGARISLRREAEALKTGPRTIYVSECVRPLKAWLAMHPAGYDAKAPLFCGQRSRNGRRRMGYTQLNKVIHRLATLAGVNERHSGDKPLTPHDFRHTCATRKARAGWNEARLRAYFGWAPGSKMPDTYVHLALGDLREQVRRDAGLDTMGYKAAVDVGNDEQQLAVLLQRILAKTATTGTQTLKSVALPPVPDRGYP